MPESPQPPKKKKKKRAKYIDDGHTVYSMAGLDPDAERKKGENVRLTRKERWAAIRAGLATSPFCFWCSRAFSRQRRSCIFG